MTAPVKDRHRQGPFRQLTGVTVKAAWDHMLPEQARTAARGMARGIIEPAARRFQHHQVKQDVGRLALAMVITRAELGGTPKADVITVDPVELLFRLRSVTAARHAGEETIRQVPCSKIAVTLSSTTAVCTVWVGDEHIRQVQTVTRETTERIVVSVLATATVTAQLWDFGVPADATDWPPLPPPTSRVLPLIQRRLQLHAPSP